MAVRKANKKEEVAVVVVKKTKTSAKSEKPKEPAKKKAKTNKNKVGSALTKKLLAAMDRKKINFEKLAKATKIELERLKIVFDYEFANVDLEEVVAIHKALGYGEVRVKI